MYPDAETGKYPMWQRIFLFIGLTVLFMSFCIVAGAQSDIEWLDAEEYTLYWGDEINHSGYLITASDFSPAKAFDTENDYVMLSIESVYGDSWGAILANNTGGISNNTVLDDRLNITAVEIITGNDIPSPYTTISVMISNSTGSLPEIVSWMDANFEFADSNSAEVYIDERAYFSVEMKNLGSDPYDSVSVIRELPTELVLDPDSDPAWNVSLDPYEKKKLEFSIKALRPGTYDITGTLISVEHNGRIHSTMLNNSTLEVHGPYINVSKSLSNRTVDLNGYVNVTIDIVNEGDRAAHVTVSDQLPVGAVLLEGNTGISRVLQAEDSISLSYSMRMDRAGDVVVPSVQAKFVDSKEYEGTVHSKKFLLQVRDPNEEITDMYEEEYSDDLYDETSDVSDDTVPVEEAATTEVEEDHGRLQFLYDILNSITEFLSNTKDKIL